MAKRKISKDPNRKLTAPAFVVEEGERAMNAKTLSMVFGCASTHDIERQLKRLMLAHHVINGRFIVDDLAEQIVGRCAETSIRALALQRIKQVAIDEILTKPEVGKRMFHECEELRKQHSSVDKLLEAMGE